jgi:tetratricopeptide (TPR) repeat protein
MSRGAHAPLAWMRCAYPALLFASCGAFVPQSALGSCTLVRLAELPVTMMGLRPIVHAGINGKDVRLIADTGAFYSWLSPAAAAQLNLQRQHAPFGYSIQGVGGDAETWLTTVKDFTLLDVPFHDVVFFVLGNDLGNDAAGVLGENFFYHSDFEYDLGNGVIRLFRPHDCKNVNFAYWAKATGQPVSQLELDYTGNQNPHIVSSAYVNGTRINVIFDTGASTSVLSLDAAKRAGISTDSPEVTPAGASSGVGRRTVRTWIAPVASFKIGDEEIKNTHLRIGESLLGRGQGDMLLGADFFLSHRIYVANSERMLFFTYNGGPVFNLTILPAQPGTQTAAPPGGAQPGAAADAVPNQPTDAGGYARRGNAAAARHDYTQAIADLSRACELAPTESAYFYERAMAHLGNKEVEAALGDLDQAIRLKPDDPEALLARARLRVETHQPAALVLADLDAADHAAPPESELRVSLGQLYQAAGNYPAAVSQYSEWIGAHGQDVRMAEALAGRCWTRAKWGQDLDAALSDCSAALRRNSELPGPHTSRGLIYLRRADYDKAITEYDTALRMNPRIPWALYGRGIAKLHKGQSAEGQADLASASAMAPRIAQEAAQIGIQP